MTEKEKEYGVLTGEILKLERKTSEQAADILNYKSECARLRRNGISSENSFINIGYGNLRADRSVCFLERVFLCYIPSFGI